MTEYKLRGTESDRTGGVHLWITRDDQPLDLEEIVADLMEQQREVKRLRSELDECRRLLREVCRDPERVEVDGVRCWEIITTDEWMQAAQAAGVGDE